MFGLWKRVKHLENREAYNSVELRDLVEDKDYFDAMIDSLEKDLNSQGNVLDLHARALDIVVDVMDKVVNADLPNAWADVQNLYQAVNELKNRIDNLEIVMEALWQEREHNTVKVIAASQINEGDESAQIFNVDDLRPGDKIRVELKEDVEGSLLPEWLNEVGGVATIESINWQWPNYQYRVTVGSHESCGLNKDEIVGRAE